MGLLIEGLLAFPQSQWSNREIEAEIDTHRRYSVSQPNLRRGLGSLLPCCIGHTESNPGTVCGVGGTQRWVQEEGDAGVIMEAVDLRISN